MASDSSSAPTITYGNKGWELTSADGNNKLQLEFRFQFRYATPWDANPSGVQDLDRTVQHDFLINRARLKVGGHAYRPWLRYFFEYEWGAGNMLDFRFMLEKWPAFNVKVGQWKAHYNRERIISSGKQQMSDRSLITPPFTIDRQQGISFYGRLNGGGAADFNYWFSVLTGTGRGHRGNDDSHLMYMSRLQWNLFGRVQTFSGSDVPISKNAEGLLALAAVTNRSPYTRFSQDGGGQLPGFAAGTPGQYRVNQFMQETAFRHRGWSWQQEFHWKQIEDSQLGGITTLIGYYDQLGYFLHGAIHSVPENLEIAVRFAYYDPSVDEAGDLQNEWSFVANWFFFSHRNKLTADVSYFRFERATGGWAESMRIRLQWDVSV